MTRGMTFAPTPLRDSMTVVEERAVTQTTVQRGAAGGSRLRTFLLIMLALVVIAVSSPARAHADYSVTQCVPPAAPYTDAGKVAFGSYSIWGTNDCGGGQLYGLRLDTNYNGAGTGWT